MPSKDKTVADVQDEAKNMPAATPDENAQQNVEDTKADADKAPDPKVYTATQDVYVGNVYYKAGEPFVTSDEPAEFWTEIDPKTAATDKASIEKVPGDAPIESLSLEALQAVAVTKNINVTGMDKDQLVTAIKAANEPAL